MRNFKKRYNYAKEVFKTEHSNRSWFDINSTPSKATRIKIYSYNSGSKAKNWIGGLFNGNR